MFRVIAYPAGELTMHLHSPMTSANAGGTLLMTGIAMAASSMGAAGVATNEDALRRNPAMRDAEERIRQLEAQLGREQQAGTGRSMFATIREVLQLTKSRRRLDYVDGLVHVAVVGTAGSGKSSLVNSIRGLSPYDLGAATVGTSETTKTVMRYRHPEGYPFVWYDIPGVGTLNQREAHYFLDQGLFMFDCIIVVFDTRFTAADIAILRYCQILSIPVCIVRSKALQHIDNTKADTFRDRLSSSNSDRYQEIAQVRFVRETQKTVAEGLRAAGLNDQRVYIVDSRTMLQVVTSGEKRVPSQLDEMELRTDVLSEMSRRRENLTQATARQA